MTNQDAMKVKSFLNNLMLSHGLNRGDENETMRDQAERLVRRSALLEKAAVGAMDLLGEIDWPDEKIKVS